MTRRRALAGVAIVAALAAAVIAGDARAQPYPTGPIRIMVGFGPGSTADTLARLVGKTIETELGQPVVVESRAGNSSMLAAELVARAPKDGLTKGLSRRDQER